MNNDIRIVYDDENNVITVSFDDFDLKIDEKNGWEVDDVNKFLINLTLKTNLNKLSVEKIEEEILLNNQFLKYIYELFKKFVDEYNKEIK